MDKDTRKKLEQKFSVPSQPITKNPMVKLLEDIEKRIKALEDKSAPTGTDIFQ